MKAEQGTRAAGLEREMMAYLDALLRPGETSQPINEGTVEQAPVSLARQRLQARGTRLSSPTTTAFADETPASGTPAAGSPAAGTPAGLMPRVLRSDPDLHLSTSSESITAPAAVPSVISAPAPAPATAPATLTTHTPAAPQTTAPSLASASARAPAPAPSPATARAPNPARATAPARVPVPAPTPAAASSFGTESNTAVARASQSAPNLNAGEATPGQSPSAEVRVRQPALAGSPPAADGQTHPKGSAGASGLAIDGAWIDGHPPWAQGRFECLLFAVAGLRLSVPLVALGGVQRFDPERLTSVFGSPQWFMGLFPQGGRMIRVIDTALWIMPEKYPPGFRDSVRYIVLLRDSDWGLACTDIADAFALHAAEVRWRGERSRRPWLAGTVIDKMCALLDVAALGALLHDAQRRHR